MRLNEFFLARQPILNREQRLFAYELLFRNAETGSADVTDELAATATVIAHANELGLENVLGSALGFLNVNADVLLSDFVEILPKDRVVLEILETVTITDELVARIAQLAKSGFKFALDDVIADSPALQKILPYVSIIKVEITDMQAPQLEMLIRQFRGEGKKLLAEKVETVVQFTLCMELGFDYFQGYYFARPSIMRGKKLSPSQLSIMNLLSLVVSDADTIQIEHNIKQDASLVLMLMRLVNAPSLGISKKIASLSHALTIIGRQQLHRWLQILLYTQSPNSKQASSPLMLLAASRGKLLELITQKRHPDQRRMADKAFTVGILSLMDALFGAPMLELLGQIAVEDDVRAALLQREGFFGEMLKLAEYTEQVDQSSTDGLKSTLDKLQLTHEELLDIQLAAFEWSEQIARQTQ